jgi:hypothetical protein
MPFLKDGLKRMWMKDSVEFLPSLTEEQQK